MASYLEVGEATRPIRRDVPERRGPTGLLEDDGVTGTCTPALCLKRARDVPVTGRPSDEAG